MITNPKFTVWNNLSAEQAMSMIGPMLILFVGATLSIGKIPSIVNSIFSGAAGQATSPIVIGPEVTVAMSETKDYNEAKQLFFAQFGNALVTNAYLKIALALVSLIALGLLVLNFKTHQIVRDFKPLVIRIDQIGRAEAVAYQNLTYKPQDVEMKYFLSQFCKLHYARNRATLKDSFSQSLYFVEGFLANTIIDGFRKSKVLESYMADPNLPEIDIDVKNIVLEEIQKPTLQGEGGSAKGLHLPGRPQRDQA